MRLRCDDDAVVLSFDVAREFDGKRADLFIQSRIPRLSRTRSAQIVRQCGFRSTTESEDIVPVSPGDRVRSGQVMFLVRRRFEEPQTPRTFDVMHQDEHVLALDKPAGLPMHPSATYHRNTLTALLRERYGDQAPHIAHRLDKETSGVVLCGRTLGAERHLKVQFERRRVKKSYLAIVRGFPPGGEGLVNAWLQPAPGRYGMTMAAVPPNTAGALHATTRFQVIRHFRRYSLVVLWPITGRQHQLRVHLAHLGHPIVGDKLYGPDGDGAFTEFIADGMTPGLRSRLGMDRQALHAHGIGFAHPEDGRWVTLWAPPPGDMKDFWQTQQDEAFPSVPPGLRGPSLAPED